MTYHRYVGSIVVGATLACNIPALPDQRPDSPTEIKLPTRDADALFQTDSLSYALRDDGTSYRGTIGVRFTNRTGATTYFVNCNGATSLRLEKLEGDQWRAAWSPILPLCLSQPITVVSGATYDSKLWVFGAYPNTNVEPKFSVSVIPGTYRIVWYDALSSYQDRLPFGTQLPFEQRVSNRFAFTIAKR